MGPSTTFKTSEYRSPRMLIVMPSHVGGTALQLGSAASGGPSWAGEPGACPQTGSEELGMPSSRKRRG